MARQPRTLAEYRAFWLGVVVEVLVYQILALRRGDGSHGSQTTRDWLHTNTPLGRAVFTGLCALWWAHIIRPFARKVADAIDEATP